jgi:aryl-alcohol dehydrogenase (NADP+)
MQNHYNLVYREEEREMLPLCRAEGIGILPWSPLARGFLSGNRKPAQEGDTERARTDTFAHEFYSRENDYAVLARLQELSSRSGYSSAQLALAWILHQPGITSPIIGATKLYQFEELLRALEIHLSPDDMKFLEEDYLPHPVLGHS